MKGKSCTDTQKTFDQFLPINKRAKNKDSIILEKKVMEWGNNRDVDWWIKIREAQTHTPLPPPPHPKDK